MTNLRFFVYSIPALSDLSVIDLHFDCPVDPTTNDSFLQLVEGGRWS
jgi:hypothetical protein